MTRHLVRICVACVVVVIASATPGRGGPAPAFNVISSPGVTPDKSVVIGGVSDDGARVVGSVTGTGLGARCAMVWGELAGMTVRCFTGSIDSGESISGDGLFIGGSRNDAFNPAYRAPALAGGAPQLANGDGSTLGLSFTGDVAVGFNRPPLAGQFLPIRWTSGTGAVDLPLLASHSEGRAIDVSSDGNVIVGRSSTTATVWRGGPAIDLGDLPGGATNSLANAVSNTNDVIVGRGTSASGNEAARWIFDGSNLLGLGDLPGGTFSSEAFDVSSDGQIIVGRGNKATGNAPFIWDSVNGMRDLQILLSVDLGLDLEGVTLRSATGISADGTVIVGNGVDAQGFQVGWHAVIPEPATGVYLLASASVLLRRRRK